MELVTNTAINTQHLKQVVGNTPLLKINGLHNSRRISIHAKLEWMQLGGSVKARPALHIIDQALINGELHREKVLLDASSGNTAIAYAALGAALGIKVAICLPENASQSRKDLLRAYGAELLFTSKFGGTDEAQLKAKELVKNDPLKYYYADQYNNHNNWKAHYLTTAEEIYNQTAGTITHLVVGLGTSGSAMGTAKRLLEINPEIKLITLQPQLALHNLEGWKHMETAIVPGIYDAKLAHDNLEIDSQEVEGLIKLAARKQGLFLSPSSAGNLAGALKVAQRLEKGVVVTVFPDDGSKYPEVLQQLLT